MSSGPKLGFMTSTNKLILDLTDDEGLRDYLADKSVGDECRLELVVSLDESTGGQAVFSVISTEAEDYDDSKEEDAEDQPAGSEPKGDTTPGKGDEMGDTGGPEEPMLDGTTRPKGPAAVLAIFKKKKS